MRIIFLVVSLHLFFLSFLFYFHPIEKEKKVSQKIKVNLINDTYEELAFNSTESELKEKVLIEEPVLETISKPNTEIAKSEKPIALPVNKDPHAHTKEVVKEELLQVASKPAIEPPKRKVEIKPETSIKPSPQKPVFPNPVKKPVQKKNTQQRALSSASAQKEKLASLLNESLKKLDKPISKAASPLITSKVPELISEGLKFEASYQDILTCLLEDSLALPEKGNVKIKLTLKKNGGFEKVEITQSESDKNRLYLQTAIQTLKFPSLQKFFPKEDVHTFSITLTSEKSR